MNYSTVFIAVIVSLLGYFHLGNLVSNEEVASIVNGILQVGGLIWILVKRYRDGKNGVTPPPVNALGVIKR